MSRITLLPGQEMLSKITNLNDRLLSNVTKGTMPIISSFWSLTK